MIGFSTRTVKRQGQAIPTNERNFEIAVWPACRIGHWDLTFTYSKCFTHSKLGFRGMCCVSHVGLDGWKGDYPFSSLTLLEWLVLQLRTDGDKSDVRVQDRRNTLFRIQLL